MSYSRTKRRDVKAEFWPNGRRERSLTVLPVVDTLEEEEATLCRGYLKNGYSFSPTHYSSFASGAGKTDLYKAPIDSGGA